MRVKICGVTRPEDAALSVSLGAWAIGMILSPRGPRFLDLAKARLVRAAIPESVLAVGVFVDETAERINELARELSLDMVQLHGDEKPELLLDLEKPAIKALSVDGPPVLGAWSLAWGVLLENKEKGKPFDWKLARRASSPGARLLVAGGLTPGNAARAASTALPFALDVSSGVESHPGEKDRSKLEAFFKAVRGHE